MGRIWIPGGGGSVDLDFLTAEAEDVVYGKVIADKDGNPLTGKLVLSGNAGAGDVRKGKTFYSTNPKSKLTGTMAEKGAATYTPNRSNQTIAANQFLTGAQTIKGDTNLLAANIKKGVTIFGVAGTWEGYVATAADWYNRGANPFGFRIFANNSNYGTWESNSIRSANGLLTLEALNKTINLSGYRYLNIFFVYTGAVTNDTMRCRFYGTTTAGTSKTYESTIAVNPGGTYTAKIAIADSVTLSGTVYVQLKHNSSGGSRVFIVYQIYTSTS